MFTLQRDWWIQQKRLAQVTEELTQLEATHLRLQGQRDLHKLATMRKIPMEGVAPTFQELKELAHTIETLRQVKQGIEADVTQNLRALALRSPF
jgi:hypothetical protein